MPQGNGFNLLNAPYKELRQPTIADLCVGTFSGRRALLVDFLGLITAHAFAPFGHAGRVIGLRRVAITACVARFWHRGKGFHTVLRQGFDITKLDEAAVDEMLAWSLAIISGQCIVHWCHSLVIVDDMDKATS